MGRVAAVAVAASGHPVTWREQVFADLIRDEGLRLKPYFDTANPPRLTIGVGRNLDDVGISRDEATYLLSNDVDRAMAELDRALPWWIQHNDNRRRVLLELVFNMGIGSAVPPKGLLSFRNTLAAIKGRDYDAAAEGLLASKWRQQVGERAVRLAALMREG